jgi:hypothetical protein
MAVPFGTVPLAWDNTGSTSIDARKAATARIGEFISVTSEENGWVRKSVREEMKRWHGGVREVKQQRKRFATESQSAQSSEGSLTPFGMATEELGSNVEFG